MSQTVSTPPPPGAPSAHPVMAAVRAIEAALADVCQVEPIFMATTDKAAALLDLTRLVDQVRELQLRVMAGADDVAEACGSRDPAAWLAHQARLDPGDCRRLRRLAMQLNGPDTRVREALRDGHVNLCQAEVIAQAVDALPTDLDSDVRDKVVTHLVQQARTFGPRALRFLGRRVVDVIDPQHADNEEGRKLEKEERDARRRTFLRSRRNGDGTTDIHARVSDVVAARLFRYLESFNSPRRDHLTPDADDADADVAHDPDTADIAESGEAAEPDAAEPNAAEPDAAEPDVTEPEQAATQPDPQPTGRSATPVTGPDDRRPYDQRMGHAFGAFLEAVDPGRLPLHGGDATTVMITIDYAAICEQLGLGLLGDEPIAAGEIRRLACNAKLIPAVLGGRSEILDLGRTARLANPAQRRALAVRDVTCRGEGCDIPATWCEAHHLLAWALGGFTDLADLVLLCSHHHHLAHDHRYRHERQLDGRIRFYRRV